MNSLAVRRAKDKRIVSFGNTAAHQCFSPMPTGDWEATQTTGQNNVKRNAGE
ncbi:MAG: hypothetical protein J6336_02055 [Kiritimatiellae bacterium]|nr:hypothetical protein [Kiritimatiellia bacterium]